MFYWDPLYLIISLPIFLLGFAATIFLKIVYSSYSKKINSKGLNGLDTVTRIAEHYNYNIDVSQGFGNLSDHYNPLDRTVSLSPEVAKMPSIASVGIAAHEMGHVAQHNNNFLLTSIRTTIAPVVNIGSNLGYFLMIIGFMLGFLNLVWVGVFLFSGTTIFSLITLPVELDASRRAINFVRELKLVDETNISGVRLVLFAAALTYVAGTVQSLGTLLYFVLRARGRD